MIEPKATGYQSHLDKVSTWLKEHVLIVPNEVDLTIKEVEVNWAHYPSDICGRLKIACSDRDDIPSFGFSIDITGKPVVYPPMFHSPLGAPASYAAVSVSEEKLNKLSIELRLQLPPIRGVRWEDEGPHPISKRIQSDFDIRSWERKMGRVDELGDTFGHPVLPPFQQREDPKAPSSVSSMVVPIGLTLLVVIPLMIFWGPIILLMCAVFWLFSKTDTIATAVFGNAYLSTRSKMGAALDISIKVVLVAGLALLVMQLISSKSGNSSDCSWGRSGEIC